jgi:hypothetical protein
MTEGKKECPLLERAHALASKIDADELSDDFTPDDASYDEILASIRHEHTNYQELLWELPPCEEICNDDEMIQGFLDGDICPWTQEAHDIIKWAAKGKAEELYLKWMEKKEGMTQ